MDQPEPTDSLSKALVATVDLFDECKIAYALVGGLASMYFGRSRYTEDVDFIAQSNHEAILQKSGESMERFGFDPSCTWKLYHETGIEVDLWKDRFADEMVQRASPVALAGRRVHIVEVHDLVAMKLRAGRFQDDYDISEILKAQTIDTQVVQARVTPEQFSHYQLIADRLKHESGE